MNKIYACESAPHILGLSLPLSPSLPVEKGAKVSVDDAKWCLHYLLHPHLARVIRRQLHKQSVSVIIPLVNFYPCLLSLLKELKEQHLFEDATVL